MSSFRHQIEVPVENVPDHLVEVVNYGPRPDTYVMFECNGVLTPVSVENAQLLKERYGGIYFTPNKVRKADVQELINRLMKY